MVQVIDEFFRTTPVMSSSDTPRVLKARMVKTIIPSINMSQGVIAEMKSLIIGEKNERLAMTNAKKACSPTLSEKNLIFVRTAKAKTQINKKLKMGWNPLIRDKSRALATFSHPGRQRA